MATPGVQSLSTEKLRFEWERKKSRLADVRAEHKEAKESFESIMEQNEMDSEGDFLDPTRAEARMNKCADEIHTLRGDIAAIEAELGTRL